MSSENKLVIDGQTDNVVEVKSENQNGNSLGITAKIEVLAGDAAREYALAAQRSAEAAASSETAAGTSEENAAESAAAAKASETAAAESQTLAADSASSAASSAESAADSAEKALGVANPVMSVTEMNGKVTVTKSNGAKNEFFAGLNMLQRNKAYAVGDIAYSPNLPSWAYLECITAGTTGDTEPDFSETQTGGVISDGTAQFQIVDQKQDGTDIDALKTELEAVKSSLASVQTAISDAENFTIIYPNGGTKSHPATVKANQRYENKNPFPGYYVRCEAQIKYNNRWGQTGFIYEGGGYGTNASQLLPEDKIITQTGWRSVASFNINAGSPFPDLKEDLSSAPCRVLVYKLGKI